MREELLEILTDCCPDVDFENETALIDDGLLESLDIVMIVTDICHQFQVEINVDDRGRAQIKNRGTNSNMVSMECGDFPDI